MIFKKLKVIKLLKVKFHQQELVILFLICVMIISLQYLMFILFLRLDLQCFLIILNIFEGEIGWPIL